LVDSDTTKDKTASPISLGSINQPVYFSGGLPFTIAHTIYSDVPEGAVFTDTTKSGVAICATSAGTAAKTATMPGFELVIGQSIILRVLITNTASNPTLNVNSTGAKNIYINGKACSTSNQLYAGEYLASPTSSV
jgi:hypothetical protein